MKNRLIKYSILIVAYLLGTFLIHTFIPCKMEWMEGFIPNFFALLVFYIAMGIFASARSFKIKKFALKENAHAFIIIVVSVVIMLTLSILYFLLYIDLPLKGVTFTFDFATLNNLFTEKGGLFIVFPFIIGCNIASILFEE